ncbi:LamG-like jellyroll fold domain-containing protein [Streptosporangium sp. NPDC000396]|uniref:LamG-like jellyroll fold domain-containing protein n=1 Tax=Streptosporangium sp. NPDC000396 TaxID=3366185 RepID=UPI0036C1D470
MPETVLLVLGSLGFVLSGGALELGIIEFEGYGQRVTRPIGWASALFFLPALVQWTRRLFLGSSVVIRVGEKGIRDSRLPRETISFRALAVLTMLAGTLVVVTPASAQAADAGLVAAYGMEEGAGNTVRDLSGNGHDGTVRDPLWVQGKIGKALRFESAEEVDRILTVPDAPTLRPSSALTVEAWVKAETEGDGCDMWSKLLDSRDASQDVSYSVGTTHFRTRMGGVDHVDNSYAAPGEWFHHALTYDGETIRFYGNGELWQETPATGTIDYGTGPLLIGGGVDGCFRGIIDEVRVYGSALSADGIQRDMVTAVASDSPPSAPGGLAVDVSSGTARLSWDAATDDNGITGYEIHRGDSADFVPSERTKVATVTERTYTEGCVERGTYFYRVVALDTLPQTGRATDAVSADITKPDCPPTAPTVAVQPRTGWAWLTFGEAQDERGVKEIQIHRSTRIGFTPSDETLLAKVGPTVREYADNVPDSATYYYRTVAVDTASHISEPSPAVDAYIKAPPDLGTSLVAAYGLDEGSGTTAANAKNGAYYPGKVTNPSWVPGKYGSALAFWQGSSVRVAGLQSFGNATISAWVKPKPTAANDDPAGISLWADGSQKALSLWAHDRFYGGPVIKHGYSTLYGHAALTGDRWVHLAATYDGDQNVTCLYVDGELFRCVPDGNGLRGTADLSAGGEGWNSTNGTVIDEIRAYDAALTPQQIRTIMNTPIG